MDVPSPAAGAYRTDKKVGLKTPQIPEQGVRRKTQRAHMSGSHGNVKGHRVLLNLWGTDGFTKGIALKHIP